MVCDGTGGYIGADIEIPNRRSQRAGDGKSDEGGEACKIKNPYLSDRTEWTLFRASGRAINNV